MTAPKKLCDLHYCTTSFELGKTSTHTVSHNCESIYIYIILVYLVCIIHPATARTYFFAISESKSALSDASGFFLPEESVQLTI